MQLKNVKVMVLVILGFFVSASVLASETEMQVAALDNNLPAAPEQLHEDLDEEIGSTQVFHFDNQLGAYSREDGSMAGAYGDGEFGD